jgi:hypothetical protein
VLALLSPNKKPTGLAADGLVETVSAYAETQPTVRRCGSSSPRLVSCRAFITARTVVRQRGRVNDFSSRLFPIVLGFLKQRFE